MTPNFALKLSEDNIVLLQRSSDDNGWYERGTVPTATDYLKDELEALNNKIISKAGSDTCIKIILPLDQLFLTSISVPNITEIEIQHALENEKTLDGYFKSIEQNQIGDLIENGRKIDSLIYDISGSPPNVSVLAAPKHLLQELEKFFLQFGFKIAGFTAIPPKNFFNHEPNLGSNFVPPIIPFITDKKIIKIIKDQKEVLETKFPKILPKEPTNHIIPSLNTNLNPKQEIEGSLNLTDDVEVKDDLNIGSFTPFADLEKRKAVDFRNRVKRYLMIVVLVMLGPTVFFSIYSISEFVMRDQPVESTTKIEPKASEETKNGESQSEKTKQLMSKPATTTEIDDLEMAEKFYKENGIWQFVPYFRTPQIPGNKYSLFDPVRDNMPAFEDAPSVSGRQQTYQEVPFKSPLSPVYQTRNIEVDTKGLVTPSKEGTLNPDGIIIYLGEAPVPARKRPKTLEQLPQNKIENELRKFKPKLRPKNMLEMQERARFGGLSRLELSRRIPIQRTKGLERAIKDLVTSNKNQVTVARISRAVPDGESPPKVVKSAVNRNVIDLRKISLIGTSGRASRTNAIIRFPNGTIEKIKLGERLDGGRVVVITQDKLQYQKNGEIITLNLPNG